MLWIKSALMIYATRQPICWQKYECCTRNSSPRNLEGDKTLEISAHRLSLTKASPFSTRNDDADAGLWKGSKLPNKGEAWINCVGKKSVGLANALRRPYSYGPPGSRTGMSHDLQRGTKSVKLQQLDGRWALSHTKMNYIRDLYPTECSVQYKLGGKGEQLASLGRRFGSSNIAPNG